MYCEDCGKKINENVTFCPYCGAKVLKEDNDETEEKSNVFYTKDTDNLIDNTNTGSELNKQKNKINYILSAIVLIVVIGLIIVLFVIFSNKKNKRAELNEKMELETEMFTNETEEATDIIVDAVSMDSLLNVSATSVLFEAGYDHSVQNIIDNNPATAWVEGVTGNGEGEGVTFYFESEQVFTGMKIRNGYQKNNETYIKNARPSVLRIEDKEGNKQFIELSDNRIQQIIEFNEPITTDEISVSIISVYYGSQCEDTCISDIEFY